MPSARSFRSRALRPLLVGIASRALKRPSPVSHPAIHRRRDPADPVRSRLAEDFHDLQLNDVAGGASAAFEQVRHRCTEFGLRIVGAGEIAEFERDLIRSRADEGIERAKRLGKKFGRPFALDDGEKRMIADRYAKGETITDLAAEYEVGVGTIHRALNSPFEASASV
jgi:hypothetical protein